MKIAIVGASKLTENEERDAQQFCGSMMNHWMRDYKDELIIISGGAEGIDTIAVECAKQLGIPTTVYLPATNNWEGYKARNIQIAEACDRLYCLPANVRDTECYHCGNQFKLNPHQKSGGCWTAKKARELGKEVRVMPPVKRS